MTFVVLLVRETSLLLTGARVNCDHCGKNAVPAYHLAMSDTSIRNFCSLPCVMTFQVMTQEFFFFFFMILVFYNSGSQTMERVQQVVLKL